ncbi:transglycosylase SLT domain-containing protein [Rhizobium sp. S-51]|uniref:Transglycosylase SLT domain-containing protein n=1 Tax=Rhizobium terricola TaxID=2728849 RepID=A0A7Y0AVR1_9HYPH|nr:phage tail tip lysozyme [Rhizobium terricola]NML74392.1 transglycosylase SLT domain-containing protein [Rhizobium terricola]
MAVMLQTRTLRAAPAGNVLQVEATRGTRIDVLDGSTPPWAKVRLLIEGKPEGWVSADAIDADSDTLPSLDKDLVARQCTEQSAMFGSNAFYLMTVAQLRSNISGTPPAGTAGPGPFCFSPGEWERHGADPGFGIHYRPEEIGDWRAQCTLAAIMAVDMQVSLATALRRQPNMTELFLAQIVGASAATRALTAPDSPTAEILQIARDKAQAEGIDPENLNGRDASLLAGATIQEVLDAITAKLAEALEAVRPLVRKAVDELIKVLAEFGGTGPVGLALIRRQSSYLATAEKKAMAKLIMEKFAAQGFGTVQQIAAVANAIAESGLNPNASNTAGERSFGLFQLNQNGGVGFGHDEAELKDPDRNIEIMLAEIAKPYQRANRHAFAATTSLHEAVRIFVHHFEKPANKTGETAHRFEIAQGLVG